MKESNVGQRCNKTRSPNFSSKMVAVQKTFWAVDFAQRWKPYFWRKDGCCAADFAQATLQNGTEEQKKLEKTRSRKED
jgi:hypothetical protein